MSPIIIFQAVLLPIILSSAISAVSTKWNAVSRDKLLYIAVCWLACFYWIVSGVNFPPKQASDWLFILVCSLFFLELLSVYIQIKNKHVYFSTLRLLIVLAGVFLIAYPVLTNTKAIIPWLEFGFTLLVLFILERRSPVIKSTRTYFMFSFGLSVLGIVSILSGSLLLGLLCVSFAAMHAVPALAKVHKLFSYADVPFLYFPPLRFLEYVVAFVLLYMVRTYVELNEYAFILLFIAFALTATLTARKYAVVILILMLGAFGVTAWQELMLSEPGYY